jgi:hypothetical protein
MQDSLKIEHVENEGRQSYNMNDIRLNAGMFPVALTLDFVKG